MLYFKMQDAIQTAKVTRSIKIVGFLWMQGESDAEDVTIVKNYGANLTAFIQALRRDLGDQSIPFAACRANPPLEEFPYAADVRAREEWITLRGHAWFDYDGLQKDRRTREASTSTPPES